MKGAGADFEESGSGARNSSENVQPQKPDSGAGENPAGSAHFECQTNKLSLPNNKSEKISDEEIVIGEPSSMGGDDRNKLFERGLLYEQNGKSDAALKCYLGCLSGLTQTTTFPLLPQCLRHVADIYYKKEDFQRAIQFIQAEKLFYENALIDISELQKQISQQGPASSCNGGGDSQNMEGARAEEYEQLARLCLERKQPHLALEYAGKATKIRQGLYGDNHPGTLQSLDFFASVYAEVGKQQYSESLGQLSSVETEAASHPPPAGQGKTETGEATPTSILRNRKREQNGMRRKSVRFRDHNESFESTDSDHDQQEHEERVSNKLLVTLFLICSILLSVLGVLLYCRIFMENSGSCLTVKSYVHFAYMKLKYYYYYYSSTKLLKYA
ncbi:uncharacterized protein LOC135466704 [Liolophura sinensis]|uniref:uncharacterized protein LOC135466704 n=1 Tax=Liolophura sinensis TaxID=3198878 RepID=UPI0031590D8F